MNLKIAAPLLLTCFALGACSESSDFDFDQNIEDARNNAPAPDIPFPNAALFAGSEDGTLNITLPEGVAEDDYSHPQVALNTLDGFSVTQPMLAGFDNVIDPTTVILGESVYVYEMNSTPQGELTGISAELVGTDVSVTAVGDSIVVLPVVPLNESTSYLVVVTNGVKILDDPLGRSPVNSVYRLTSGEEALTGSLLPLEDLRQLNAGLLAATAGRGFEATEVINIWTTRTQSITPAMNAVKAASQAGGAINMAPTGSPTPGGLAEIYIGTLDVPYYRTAPATVNDPVGITSFWRGQGEGFLTAFNPAPVATSTQTIPVLMSVPNSGETPGSGWPVAIFVHGITNDRTFMLAIADRMAGAGFAVIAIDQAMHGITDESDALSATSSQFTNDVERHFGIDLANNETGAAGPDGVVDSSGTHFFNPSQLLATRDNLRQSVADLLVLSASIGNIAAVQLDASRQALIGHSLGGSTATTFAAFADNLSSVSLAMPAAGLVKTVIASPAFRDPVIAGLAASGIDEGTPAFDSFVVAAQTVTDPADPIVFGELAASRNPIHMIELIGDNVVPNTVDNALLAGTEQLARVMGLPSVTASTSGSGIVRFTQGNHGSILSPEASQAVFDEMQTQVATFAFSGGTQIAVGAPDLIVTAEQ